MPAARLLLLLIPTSPNASYIVPSCLPAPSPPPSLDLVETCLGNLTAVALEPLPAGNVLSSWSIGPAGQCTSYDEASDSWRNMTTLPYGECAFCSEGA